MRFRDEGNHVHRHGRDPDEAKIRVAYRGNAPEVHVLRSVASIDLYKDVGVACGGGASATASPG